MSKNALLLFALLALHTLLPPRAAAQSRDSITWRLRLEQADITARRPLRDIGTTRTRIDTVILRESVTNSVADILSQSTSVFIKNYGRGTLATASFRGTAPSHTQVLWNGMKINSPMLGQVDFSLIPSYFIDDMTLYHGASSVNVAGGGLGGAITLNTKPLAREGYELQFTQGISSYRTFDEYLHFRYAAPRWQTSTRLCYVTSRNDFPFRNINRVNILPDGSVSEEIPTERNRNGDYRDLHLLQEFYYDRKDGNRFSAAAWWMNSTRGIPMLFTDQRKGTESRNQQQQNTLRLVGAWEHYADRWKSALRAGYNYDHLHYTYRVTTGDTHTPNTMVRTLGIAHSAFLQGEGQYALTPRLMLTANLTANLHHVDNRDRINDIGYNKNRAELSALATLRYRPHPRIGLAADLRGEYYGKFTPLIPAAFLDVVLSPRLGLVFKASATRNYRYPTLNDLYFLPGGNDTLRPERGFTYDGGIECTLPLGTRLTLRGEASAYDSRITDWILWLPARHGYWTPLNVKRVHSYGTELKANATLRLGDWTLWLDALWSYTRSVNRGEPFGPNDQSVGKQLVYIPLRSASVMGRLSWRGFTLTYKYNHFSERHTTSSNNPGRLGILTPYYMNDLSLEKRIPLRFPRLARRHTPAAVPPTPNAIPSAPQSPLPTPSPSANATQSTSLNSTPNSAQSSAPPVILTLRIAVNNLFNEEYISVLGHPMPRRNYGLFLSITPRW